MSDAAAAGAYAIGNAFDDQSGFWTTSNPLYATEHAILGCAAGAASGTGCASGAIGGATSAVLNPLVDTALGGDTPPVMLTVLSMLAGGSLAGALGYNATAAATAAENETLNNYLNHRQVQSLLATLKSCAPGDTSCVSQTIANYQSVSTQQQQAAQNCNSVTGCRNALNDAMGAVGVSESDIEAACQGGTLCTQMLDSLANQGSSAKSIAASNWNSVSTSIAQQNQYQSAFASSGSSTLASLFGAISPLDASGAVDGITSTNAGTRPSWRQSEIDVGSELGSSARPQVSYLDGVEVPNGTPGSVRPDLVATDETASFEVKNYNIATNSSGLVNNVAQQAIQRSTNLPAGMQQQIIIDTRGQTVTDAQMSSIIQGIVQKSNGIINPGAIQFK